MDTTKARGFDHRADLESFHHSRWPWITLQLLRSNHHSTEFLDSFYFIGVDLRGVGLSLPVQCDEAIYNERVSLFPKPQSESDEMVDKYKRLEESCLKLTGKIVSTPSP
jgi:hypothetical protein